MVQSDYLKAMLRAHAAHDEEGFREAAESLIELEGRKGHRLLARDLKQSLRQPLNGQGPAGPRPRIVEEIPADDERGFPLADVQHPNFGLERSVLSEPSREAMRALVEDFGAREIFASFGIASKRKVLFFGPPGCGKTITAHALAGELGLPLLHVRFDSLISSYLGQTAANLRKLFDFASRSQWVVLFDEFDAVGRSRDDPSEHGELKRVINSILQMMDGFRGDSLLVAATNHEQALDPALWRRFDEIVKFDVPDERNRLTLLGHFLASVKHSSTDLRVLASDTESFTGSDLENVAVESTKQMILARRKTLSLDDLMFGLKRQRNRMALSQSSEGE
jgi:SpoVK/Ycf46/Vps4 family AAA+-type ATPase